MELYDKISPKEKDMIRNYIAEYGSRSDYAYINPEHIDLEHVLRFWSKNKSVFLDKMFGQNLIIEKDFECIKSQEDLENDICVKMNNLTSDIAWKFEQNYSRLINKLYNNDKISYEVLRTLEKFIFSKYLASNRYDGDSFSIPLANDKEYKIIKGQKISKILGKISTSYELGGWEDYRILHSQVLNEKTIKGTMCLSIHPLDYLTMSDNDCGWTSCMTWKEKGDYRQGTVEMMNSRYVVIAYLKSSTDMSIEPGHWNSKRWRELFVVDENLIAGIKGYPYWNRGLEKFVLNWIKELLESNLDWNYLPEIYHYDAQSYDIKDYKDSSLINFGLRMTTGYMYNDFYTDHNIYISPNLTNNYVFNYSGESECMKCGDIYRECEEYCVLDPCCDDVELCDDCGCVLNEDETYNIDGMTICYDCYANYVEECNICHNEHFYNNMYSVCLEYNNKIYRNYRVIICEDCFHDNEKIHTYDGYYYFKLNELSSEELNDLFYINSADDLKYSFYSYTIEIEEEKGE